MYFTKTPTLNSFEAIMKKAPHETQKGGGRNRSPYRYSKEDCDCRFCLYYQRKGCTVNPCPVLDIRLECGAASFYEATCAVFDNANCPSLKRRLYQLYKDGDLMIYQNDRHKTLFETETVKLRKADNRTIAVLYLLTAERQLWQRARQHLHSGKVELEKVRLGGVSADSYALGKVVREIQTGEKQVAISELADEYIVSDKAFCLIVQAMTIARFGAAVLKETEETHV